MCNVLVPWTNPSPARGTGVHCGTAKGVRRGSEGHSWPVTRLLREAAAQFRRLASATLPTPDASTSSKPTHRQPTPLWRTGCRGSNSTLCATALPSEHAHATRSTVADRRLSQLAAAYALWMLFSGVEAQQPTAARRCGSFRIAAVQLLSEAADVERGRISKIQKHCVMRLRAAMPESKAALNAKQSFLG